MAPVQLTSPKFLLPLRASQDCCRAGLEFGLSLRTNHRWGMQPQPLLGLPQLQHLPSLRAPSSLIAFSLWLLRMWAFMGGGGGVPPFSSHFKARSRCSPSGFLPLVTEGRMGRGVPVNVFRKRKLTSSTPFPGLFQGITVARHLFADL